MKESLVKTLWKHFWNLLQSFVERFPKDLANLSTLEKVRSYSQNFVRKIFILGQKISLKDLTQTENIFDNSALMSNFAGTMTVAESADKNRTPLDPLTSYSDDEDLIKLKAWYQ